MALPSSSHLPSLISLLFKESSAREVKLGGSTAHVWIGGEEPRPGEEMGAVRSSFPYHSTAQPGVEPPLTRLPAHRAEQL